MLTGFEDLAHLGCGVAIEDGRPCDEDLGARFGHKGRGFGGDAPVDRYGDVGYMLDTPDFRDHLGDEVLATESGVDAHDVHVVDVREGPLYELGRGGRAQGDARLAASSP